MTERTQSEIKIVTVGDVSITSRETTVTNYILDDRITRYETEGSQECKVMGAYIHLNAGAQIDVTEKNVNDIYILAKADYTAGKFDPKNEDTEYAHYEATEATDIIIATWGDEDGSLTVTITEQDEEILVPITQSARRIQRLMGDDCITLSFTLPEAKRIAAGAYCDDEIFGRFYVTEEQMPKYNTSNGGYDYDLKMEAWYKIWNLKIFMLTASTNAGARIRKETQWHLTQSLQEQMREFMVNLQALGHVPSTYAFYNDNIKDAQGKTAIQKFVDIDTEIVTKHLKAECMDYSSTHMIDALQALADKWECEYWITGNAENFVIHFGKCEAGETQEISLESNVESMEISNDTSEKGNKIFVYGSTDNVPTTYRKKLIIHNVQKDGENRYTIDKPMSSDMIVKAGTGEASNYDISETLEIAKTATSTTIQDPDYEGTHQAFSADKISATKEYKAGRYNISSGLNYVRGGFITSSSSNLPDTITVVMKAEVTMRATDGTVMVQLAEAEEEITIHKETDSESGATFYSLPDADLVTQAEKQITVTKQGYIETSVTVLVLNSTIQWNGNIDFSDKIARVECTLHLEGQQTSSNYAEFLCTIGNREIWARINPAMVQPTENDYYRRSKQVGYFHKLPDGSIGTEVTSAEAQTYGLWNGTGSGGIEVNENYQGVIPSAYYTNALDNPTTLLSVGNGRLQLPAVTSAAGGDYWMSADGKYASRNGYIIPAEYIGKDDAPELREISVAFEDIYPDAKLLVSEVCTEDKQSVTEYEGETKTSLWDWRQYHLRVKHADGSALAFSKDYIQSGNSLRIRFLIPEDIQSYVESGKISQSTYAKIKSQCNLAGMQFEAEFKASTKYEHSGENTKTPHTQDYAIVRNSDFGALLPNETLKPQVDDPCVLIGWNVRALGALGLIAKAEEELLQRGFEYAAALRDDNFTFTCNMMSDSFEPALGKKVTVKHSSLRTGEKVTRIIGYELNLDKPYDTPKLTIGETEAYSRIKQMEKKITKL